MPNYDDPTLAPDALLAAARSADLAPADIAAALANPNLPLDEVALDVTTDRRGVVHTVSEVIDEPKMHQALLANPALPLFLLTDPKLAHRLLVVLLAREIVQSFEDVRHQLTLHPQLGKNEAFTDALFRFLKEYDATGGLRTQYLDFRMLKDAFSGSKNERRTIAAAVSAFFGNLSEAHWWEERSVEAQVRLMLASIDFLLPHLQAPQGLTLGPFVAGDLLGAYG